MSDLVAHGSLTLSTASRAGARVYQVIGFKKGARMTILSLRLSLVAFTVRLGLATRHQCQWLPGVS